MKTKINTKKINTKSVKKWIIIISFVFSFVNCGQAAIAADITAQRMIGLINESRKDSGLLPLKVNDKLIAAAAAKADDMFKFQYFDHNSPSGLTPWHWIKSAGYDYLYAGENLAIDFVTAEGTHMALMRSIAHRDNILKPEKIVEENIESKVVIKGDVDISLPENKPEEIKIKEIKKKLVEIKSPVVYFRDEDYEKNKNEAEEVIIKEVITEKINREFVLPIMFPLENIKPLDETLTEDIFWNNYEGENKKTFGKIIYFFNYKFWLVELCVLV